MKVRINGAWARTDGGQWLVKMDGCQWLSITSD